MRSFSVAVFLGCFGVLLALLLGEVALRVLPVPDLEVLAAFQDPPESRWRDPAWMDPPDAAFRLHPVIGYEHAPKVDLAVPLAEHDGGSFRFRTNNLGLRHDSDTAVEKAPDVFRLLVLGDSHVDGYVDNDESFSTLLASRLTARLAVAGRRVEVLNAGVAGYSPAHQYLWYKVHGVQLRPDLVLVVFFSGNDIGDLLDPRTPVVDPITGERLPSRRRAARDPSGPLDQFRLTMLARYAIQVGPLSSTWSQFGLPGRLDQPGGQATDTLIRVLHTCHGCYWGSLQQAARVRQDREALREALGQASAILGRLERDVRESGGRLAVTLLPSRAQAEPTLAEREQRGIAELLGLNEADVVLENEIAQTMLHRLALADVPALALRDPLRVSAQGETLYYSRDWHLNARGHWAVAEILEGWLAETGLVRGLP